MPWVSGFSIETGFTGEFDIDLDYTNEDAMKTPGSAAPDGAGGNEIPAGPNLSLVFAAKDQRGRKLQPAKGPVEVS